MPTFQLEEGKAASTGTDADVLACAYLPDNSAVLSCGWDGALRLWDAAQGQVIEKFDISDKPLSACAVSADGEQWLVGTMDGMLSQWNAATQEKTLEFLAHTRPIADLVYSPDGQEFASVGWDNCVHVWNIDRLQWEGRKPLGRHSDIVSGCRFTPDGKRLLSWSYDGTLTSWDVNTRMELLQLAGHEDRIMAGAVSPDGRWLVTGARNGEVKLWELQYGQEATSLGLSAGILACFFLLDAKSVVLVDANGRLTLHQVPDLGIEEEISTQRAVQAVALAPSGAQLALGDDEGQLMFVSIDGFDAEPLAVTAAQRQSECTGMFRRLIGGRRTVAVLECVCPACRWTFEVQEHAREQPVTCPQCCRSLRICAVTEMAEVAT